MSTRRIIVEAHGWGHAITDRPSALAALRAIGKMMDDSAPAHWDTAALIAQAIHYGIALGLRSPEWAQGVEEAIEGDLPDGPTVDITTDTFVQQYPVRLEGRRS